MCKMYNNYYYNSNKNNDNTSNNNNNYNNYVADFCKGHCTMLLYEATCNDIKLHKIYHSKTKKKQGAKKVNFTACHSGKLQLTCSNPRVNFIGPK